jgi:DNA-binding response OmpR family regulator
MRRLDALVITANQEQVQQYTIALQEAGFVVQVATTGARAQVQLTFTNPDLILLDLDLPDIPGDVILRQIIAQRRLDTTSLILLSHRGDPAHEKINTDTHVITKPVKSDTLTELAHQEALARVGA